jgi:hypothetical protein
VHRSSHIDGILTDLLRRDFRNSNCAFTSRQDACFGTGIDIREFIPILIQRLRLPRNHSRYHIFVNRLFSICSCVLPYTTALHPSDIVLLEMFTVSLCQPKKQRREYTSVDIEWRVSTRLSQSPTQVSLYGFYRSEPSVEFNDNSLGDGVSRASGSALLIGQVLLHERMTPEARA